MGSSSNRKRRSTSSSPGKGSGTKRRKDGRSDLDKENSANMQDELDQAEQESSEQALSHQEEEELQAGAAPNEAEAEDYEPEYQDEEEEEDDNEDMEDIDDQAEDEENATGSEILARNRSSMNPGRSAEAGIIKTVYCENFMCHRKLTVELNRNVTFIHGANGSGKSAVLAAIQICLGAGARRTHRARNLKDLVRRDAASNAIPSCAIIRITIHNQGSDAYKHDVYGDMITVERRIAATGGYNGYKLIDDKGHEKSRNKKDLDEMLDTLNIQVENPVAVLDQEEAKKFLMGKAEDKYNFFMKATELERVSSTVAHTMDKIEEMQVTSNREKENLTLLYEKVDALKKKWNEHQELGKLEDKLLKLNAEWAWARFGETNTQLQEEVQAKEALEEKSKKKQVELAKAEEEADGPNSTIDKKKERMDQLLLEAQEQANLKRTLDAELKDALAPHKDAERQLSILKKRKEKASKGLRAAKQSLQEARDQILQNADSAESEEARRTAALKEAEEELAECRSRIDQLKQIQSKWLHSYEEVEPHVQDAKSRVANLQNQLQATQNKLRSLASSTSGDSLAVFGPRVSQMAALVAKAKKQNKFHGEVVGPIGFYLKVAPGKEEYSSIVEVALGSGALDRFVVTNDHDSSVLRELRRQAGCVQDCNVFQIPVASRYNVPAPPRTDGVETIASVLSIDNAIVFNALVDNAKIDQKALARSREISQTAFLIESNGKKQLRAPIKDVYCLPKGDNWQVKGGAIATFSNSRALKKTIGVDRSAAIAEAQREEARLKDELKQEQREESKLENEHSKSQREWNRAKKDAQLNDARINDLSDKIAQIKEEMETSAHVTIDTAEFENDVQEKEEALEGLQDQERALAAAKEDCLPLINDVKGRLDDCVVRTEKIGDDIKGAEADLTQFLETQTQIKDRVTKLCDKLGKYQKVLQQHEERIAQMSEGREEGLAKARKIHHRYLQRDALRKGSTDNDPTSPTEASKDVSPEELEAIEPQEVSRDKEYYQARIVRAKAKIAQERERRNVSNEDAADAFEAYSKAKKDLEVQTEANSLTEQRIIDMEKDVEARQKRWKVFRKHLDRVTKLKFAEMLSMNNCNGDLDFDHETGKLDLAVQKNTSESQSETRDVKALSGGERSYTTMCLLLALGESLETPFRILDEFDVFLDPEVRKLTIKSLIHVAKRMKHRQFIFITPQDLSSITPDNELKILKLNPPDRHKNAGGPSQQTLDFASQHG